MQYSETKKAFFTQPFPFSCGALSALLKLLEQPPALDILAHRIIWSFVFMCIVLFSCGNGKQGGRALFEKERRHPFFISRFYPDFD